MQRRNALAGMAALALAGRAGRVGAAPVPGLSPLLPDGTRAEAELATLPGKQTLIRLTERPPNYETPTTAFVQPITPNDQFFVRYHLAGIPEAAELRQRWSVKLGGDAVRAPDELGLDELRRNFSVVELAAVNQCSGARRGLCLPHVPGVQWGAGAMGGAVWRGVRLKDVLMRAGVQRGAVEVAFAGADGPVMDVTPPFRKSLPIDKAMEESVLLAFAMNGEALPHLNGLPLRLVVPGWTGTYWMKHLDAIEVRSKPLDSFWMRKSYRVPKGIFPVDLPFTSQEEAGSVPITEIVVNSLIANVAHGSRQPASGFTMQGVAWDRGHGIRAVEVSTDGGATWKPATLGPEQGRFAFRPWRFETGALPPGKTSVVARATSRTGETQAKEWPRNPAGYHNNVPQPIAVEVM